MALRPLPLLCTALIALLCARTATATVARFSAVYAFGDSWVDDNGVNGTWKAFRYPPSPPNQFRFSNGPTFPFYVARDGGLNCNWADSNTSAGVRCSKYVNFAQGGACANPYLDNPTLRAACSISGFTITSLPDQVTLFANAGINVTSTDLFLISIGGNDINAWLALSNFGTSLENVWNQPAAAQAYILDAVRRLYAAGGRRFLLLNTPDLLLTPRGIATAATLTAGAVEAADEFIEDYAKDFSTNVIQAARNEFPSASVWLGNIRGCMREKSRGQYGGWTTDGFNDTVNPCVSDRDQPNATICASPDSRIWWDPIHPTTRWHQWLGGQILRVLDGGNSSNTCLATNCVGDSLFDECFDPSGAPFGARPGVMVLVVVAVVSVLLGVMTF